MTPRSPLAFCAALTEGDCPRGWSIAYPGPVRRWGGVDPASAGGEDRDDRIHRDGQTYPQFGVAIPQEGLPELGGNVPRLWRRMRIWIWRRGPSPTRRFETADNPAVRSTGSTRDASIAGELVADSGACHGHDAGDGISDPKVDLGPMATAEGVAMAADHVADALALGATLVTGAGHPPGTPMLGATIICPPCFRIARPDEGHARGDVWSGGGIAAYDRIEDAIALANDTSYGLVSYLFTRDFATTVLGQRGAGGGHGLCEPWRGEHELRAIRRLEGKGYGWNQPTRGV